MSVVYYFLSLPITKFVIAPLLTLTLGNLLKYFSQRKSVKRSVREYFFVGPNALAAGFLISFIDISQKLNKAVSTDYGTVELPVELVDSMMLLCGIFIFVPAAMMYFINNYGWEKVKYGGFQLKVVEGIVIPDIVSLSVLFVIFSLLK